MPKDKDKKKIHCGKGDWLLHEPQLTAFQGRNSSNQTRDIATISG